MTGDVVALASDLTITGEIEGDLVAWQSTVRLGPEARIGGSLLLVGGSLEPSPGARVSGRTLVWADLADVARATLLQPTAAIPASLARWTWGLRLASLAGWLVLALALAVAGRRSLERAARGIRSDPLRTFLAGVAVFLAAFLLAWALVAAPFSGVAGVLLVVLVLLSAIMKIVGMAAVFLVVGRWLGALRGRAVPLASPLAITFGVLALGLLRYLPAVGAPVWVAASLIGVWCRCRIVAGADPTFRLTGSKL